MKLSPKTQALLDSILKATSKKSSFSPSQTDTIQKDKSQTKLFRCPNCNTIIA